MVLIAVCVGCIVLFYLFWKRRNNENLPPAAWTTPIVGCLSVLGSKNIAEEMLKVGKRLGPVVRTHLGFQKLVILNGPEAVKEAFRNSSLCGRPNVLYGQFLGGKGVVWPDDVKETRKFISKCSRHFEFASSDTENTIQDEITVLLEKLKSYNGKLFQVRNTFNIPTLNAIFKLLLGVKIPHDDPEFRYFVERLDMAVTLPNPIMRACVFYPPLLKWVPSFLSRKEKIEGPFKDGLSLIERYFRSSLVGHTPNQPRRFADAMKDKIDETTDSSSAFHIDQKSDAPIIFDLLLAAIDTTSSMIEWMVLYLSQFPAVQKNLQAEIDKVLQNERFPSLSDRSNMPYTMAVIHEVFRLAPVVPYGIHKATKDTALMGYMIEKGTYIVGNYYGIHMDADLWRNPQNFNPGRFLDESGNFIKSELLFTFGYGKRSCVGEVSGRDQVFLFVTRILQQFNILPEKIFKNLSGRIAFVYHCVEFQAKFVPRIYD